MTSKRAYELAKTWKSAPDKTILVVTPTEKTAQKFYSDLQFFTSGSARGEVCLFPAPDALPYTRLTTQQDIWIDRLAILYKLFTKEPLIVVASIESYAKTLPPPWIFSKYRWNIYQNDSLNRDELSKWLTEAGYINQPLVEDEGAYSLRGGIVDIFPSTSDKPVRIELDGDQITSLRTFDPITQKSSFKLSGVTLTPARNVIINEETSERIISQLKDLSDAAGVKPSERREVASAIQNNFYLSSIETLSPLFYEKMATLEDYLPEDALIFIDDEIEIRSEIEKLHTRLADAHATAKHIEKIIPPEKIYKKELPVSHCEPLEKIVKGEAIQFINLNSGDRHVANAPRDDKTKFSTFGRLKEKIREWQRQDFKIILTCHTTTQADRLLDMIRWQEIGADATESSFQDVLRLGRSSVWIMIGSLSKGFISEEDKLVILTDEDIFGSKISKRTARSQPIETFTDFSELTEGSFIVHRDHGIGRYMGLKNMKIGGVGNDFLTLEYLGGDKLYLPVWRINLISRHIGASEDTITLDKLGGTRWTKSQTKVTAAIRTMAMELLKIYAEREARPGFAFSGRDQMLEEFEANFPYDETPDQWRSIEETLEEMQKPSPADRLICGDVGYGKTEVAMRAAFKAVADGKQVAILVPTTVLAFQHYENFIERFAKWPVKIEMLSRFRSRTEQKHIAADLSRGAVDIIIGTHRLLQRDIKLANLGLLIIDEEHRFGVAHKEKIRKIRSVVDTITMSATPIPRTLHMSLSGMRNISIINTPPANRLAIRTYVAEYNDQLIRSAIIAELARGGQVFFVHNRVETIQSMFDRLRKLVPEAKIVVGHGQMDEHELEDTMLSFIKQEANLLLCTTIIESGLDISHANTMIINRADTFGLAQLYQLRGRVGRSNVQAYAYLLTPDGVDVSPTAKKRLSLLQRYTELGSGFQIAMHDLEIRGAGNILGAQQSGHVNAIGYEMYVELLEKMIRQLQGKEEEIKLDPEISIPVPAYIPIDYIADEGQRLVMYRRLTNVSSIEDIDALSGEMTDRFGPMPDIVNNLLGIIEIKVLAKNLLIESIQFDEYRFAYKFHPNTPIRSEIILKMVESDPRLYSFKQPATLIINEKPANSGKVLSTVKAQIRKI